MGDWRYVMFIERGKTYNRMTKEVAMRHVENIRVVVVNGEGGVIELVNPAIAEENTETQEVPEGSIAPGAPRATVARPKSVTVSAFDRNGNPVTVSGSGFLAATFCHEIDHLDGILFTDKAKKGKQG